MVLVVVEVVVVEVHFLLLGVVVLWEDFRWVGSSVDPWVDLWVGPLMGPWMGSLNLLVDLQEIFCFCESFPNGNCHHLPGCREHCLRSERWKRCLDRSLHLFVWTRGTVDSGLQRNVGGIL